MPDADQSRTARAFGVGCDARLAGEPPSAVPYRAHSPDYAAWRLGWRHMHESYGCDVRGRWPYLALPAVREAS